MQTVLVNRRIKYDKKTQIPKLKKAKAIIQPIIARYLDGRVKTSSGDVWEVAPYPGKGADFIVTEREEL